MIDYKKFKIPPTRNPFCNAQLIPAGIDSATGKRRFWISSYNGATGSIGLLVYEGGGYKVYRLGEKYLPGEMWGFYAAVYAGNETVWLCGDLSKIYSLNLTTGETAGFVTGAPPGLVFSGINYDEKSGKLLFSSGLPDGIGTVSFDIKQGKTARIYRAPVEANLSYAGFPNGDGTHTHVYTHFGDAGMFNVFARWNPENETLEEKLCLKTAAYTYGYPADEKSRYYVPGYGRLNPETYAFENPTGCKPAESISHINWFSCRGGSLYGAYADGDTAGRICRWDAAGETVELCRFPDFSSMPVLTEGGEIIAVNKYGEIFRFSLEGKLLEHVETDTVSTGEAEYFIKIDDKRMLGTSFITLRFWVLDTETGEGRDGGRAATRGGEVALLWNIDGRIYMASYTAGALTEYDPQNPSGRFPVNPRVIVKHPPRAYRPIAKAEDGKSLYYACTHEKGQSGSTAVKYTPKTGETLIIEDVLPGQQIHSLRYDKKRGVLLGGSSYINDFGKGTGNNRDAYALWIDPATFRVIRKFPAPRGSDWITIFAQKSENEYYADGWGEFEGKRHYFQTVWDLSKPEACFEGVKPFGGERVHWHLRAATEDYGGFVIIRDGRVHLTAFDGLKFNTVKTFEPGDEFVRAGYSCGDIYAATRSHIYIFKK